MNRAPLRILHLDDDASLLKLGAIILSSAGFEVHSTQDVEAVRQARFSDYELFILDLLLPTANGLALCRELRAKGWTGPLMILSSKMLSLEERREMQKINVLFAMKPFGPAELIQAVQNSLAGRT